MTDASQVLIATDLVKAATIGFLRPTGQRFKVTDKGGDRSQIRVQWGIGSKFAIGIAVIVASVVYGQFNLDRYPHTTDVVVSLFWSLYSILVLTIAALTCIELPRAREEEHTVSEPCELRAGEITFRGRALRLSSKKAFVELPNGIKGEKVEIRFKGFQHSFPARIVASKASRYELEFTAGGSERDQLVRWIFSGAYARRPASLDPVAIYRRLVRSILV